MITLLLIKALHIIFMVAWFAGLFYLPRLFAYHAAAEDGISLARFKLMERRLYWVIMCPSAVLTLLFGGWLLIATWSQYASALWLQIKLVLVLALYIYHGFCGYWLRQFARDANRTSAGYFRFLNEVPTLALVFIVILAVVKPG